MTPLQSEFWKHIGRMKTYFLTGFVAMLPFMLTLIIVIFAINFFTDPFQDIVENFFKYYNLINMPVLVYFSSKLLILALLIGLTTLVGFLGQGVIIKTGIHYGTGLIERIPVINKLYRISNDVVRRLFDSKEKSFSQVALVPFPHSKALSLALLAENSQDLDSNTLVSVFIPGSPIPTIGLTLMYRYDEIMFIDMKVEEALKLIVSCGVIFPPIRTKTQ